MFINQSFQLHYSFPSVPRLPDVVHQVPSVSVAESEYWPWTLRLPYIEQI